jgi:hypothetical protein
MSPNFGSKSSVPEDDCLTCAGRAAPSYLTGPNREPSVASG